MGELLKGKVVVVTGGNKGLGRAMAVAAEGATLVIGGRTEKDGQEAVFNLNIRAAFFCAKHAVASMMGHSGDILHPARPARGRPFDPAGLL